MSIFATPTAEAVIPTGMTPAADVPTEPRVGADSPQPAVRLSPLGMHLEMLRLERGLSKQALARIAGTSRQQLWRVMTGKSELTSSLCFRLASGLGVDSRTLSTSSLARPGGTIATLPLTALRVGDYLASAQPLRRTLSTLPAGQEGLALKRALLDAVERLAERSARRRPDWLPLLRTRVESGEL